MVSFLKGTFVYLLLHFFLSIPLAFMGWVAFKEKGIVMVVLIVTAFLFFLLVSAEKWVSAIFPIQRGPLPRGLQMTLHRVGEVSPALLEEDFPVVYLFHDPAPRIFLARSLGSKGIIFLSQGALVSFSEEELRAAMRDSIRTVRKAGLPVLSLLSILMLLLLKWVPKSWQYLITVLGTPVKNPLFTLDHFRVDRSRKLTPRQALQTLAILPFYRFLMRLAGWMAREYLTSSIEFERKSVARKMSTLPIAWDYVQSPALIPLHLGLSPSSPA